MAAAAVLYSLIFNTQCVKIVCQVSVQRVFFISLICEYSFGMHVIIFKPWSKSENLSLQTPKSNKSSPKKNKPLQAMDQTPPPL